MYKINICPIKVCKTQLGAKPQRLVQHIQRTNSIVTAVRCAVWIEALEKECNKPVYNRVQRLIIIKIAKAFRTASNEALCTLTGLTPIVIKAEETAKLYSIVRKNQAQGIDYEVQPKDWLHPANTIRITEQHEQQEQHAIQIFTDGRKSEHGV